MLLRSNLASHIRSLALLTPLEVLERWIKDYGVKEKVATDLFGAYGEFLSVLADDGARKALGSFAPKIQGPILRFGRSGKLVSDLSKPSMRCFSKTLFCYLSR